MISTQFSKAIKVFRTDNAMEYRDSQFLDFIHTQDTIIQHSCAGTSQQNGRAERKHCHILDSVRAFLISASYLEHFLGKPPSLLSTPSTVFHSHLSKICLPLNVSMVLYFHILLFVSLVAHVLF
jgi:hypothetical protein